MEKGLRECCRSMRIGKILIRRDQETRLPRVSTCPELSVPNSSCLDSIPFQVYYAKFPPQIDKRQILLLHPVLGVTIM